MKNIFCSIFFLLISHFVLAQSPFTPPNQSNKVSGKQYFLDSLAFLKFKNNASMDSVLTTNSAGIVRFKLGGGGGSQDTTKVGPGLHVVSKIFSGSQWDSLLNVLTLQQAFGNSVDSGSNPTIDANRNYFKVQNAKRAQLIATGSGSSNYFSNLTLDNDPDDNGNQAILSAGVPDSSSSLIISGDSATAMSISLASLRAGSSSQQIKITPDYIFYDGNYLDGNPASNESRVVYENLDSTETTTTWIAGFRSYIGMGDQLVKIPYPSGGGGSSQWRDTTSSAIYYPLGNVAVGNVLPASKFHVDGISTFANADFDGTLAPTIYFAHHDYPTSYRNKISTSVSAAPYSQKMVFSLANGASTFADVLSLTGLGNVGIGGLPGAYSVLDVISTTQGSHAAPSMTAAQRLAISTPQYGDMVYDTDSTRYMVNRSGTWRGLAYTYETGGGSGGSSFTRQVITSGTSATVTGGNYIVTIDPVSTIATYTLTLPASPSDLDVVEIDFGGTLTSGGIVTSLTVSPNSGQTILDNTPPTSATADNTILYRYRTANTTWYRFKP